MSVASPRLPGERQGDLVPSTKVWTPEEIRTIRASAKIVDWGWLAKTANTGPAARDLRD